MSYAALQLSDLITTYNSLRSEFAGRLATFRPVMLERPKEELITDPTAIEDAVKEHEMQHDGWCRRASWVGRTPVGVSRTDPGRPLDGEWVIEPMTSRRLFYDGRGWHLITIAESADDAIPALRQDIPVRANATANGATALWYAVYWAAPEDGAFRRIACRLLGFKDDER